MGMNSTCPTDQELEQFISGASSAEPDGPISSHVRTCHRCARWVAEAQADECILNELRRVDSWTTTQIVARPPFKDPAERGSWPDRIGEFRIIRPLGSGGMGVVYEADQDRPQRRVALKLLRAGIDSPRTLRRFEHEAEVLARLQHPGIAQVFAAGMAQTVHGPQPYLAMELVAGQRLTQYAVEKRLGTRQRLSLVAEVADAVQHAHQRGVIHRDIKPSNILVDGSGRPRVLDFGIARVVEVDSQTSLHTDIGQLVGTLPYMSPEQAAGDPRDIDTRSDVYALGVLGYELLTGRLPHDLANRHPADAARIIREEDVTPLSVANRSLRGDVETIISKALEKDRTRRYSSAAELADDIRRYLNNEAILGRRASRLYQLRKFAARNRALVGGVVATILALSLGLAASLRFGAQANRARLAAESEQHRAQAAELQAASEARRAQSQATRAERIEDFMARMLQSADPTRERATLTVRDMLDNAALQAPQELSNEPEVLASVLDVIGRTYDSLGEYGQAEPVLRQALQLREQQDPVNAERLAISRMHLGAVLDALGRNGEAEPLLERALEEMRTLHGDAHPYTLDAMQNLASLRDGQGRNLESQELYRAVLAVRETLNGPSHPLTLEALHNLGTVLHISGKSAEAAPLMHAALERSLAARGEHDSRTVMFMQGVGIVEYKQQNLPAALQHIRRAYELSAEVFGPEHKYTQDCGGMLAVLELQSGRVDLAEPVFRTLYNTRQATLGPTHIDVIRMMINVGYCAAERGSLGEAEDWYLQAADLLRRFHPQHHELRRTVGNLADLMMTESRFDEAVALRRELVQVCDETDGVPQALGVQARALLADSLTKARRTDEAVSLWRQVLQLGADTPDLPEPLWADICAGAAEAGVYTP